MFLNHQRTGKADLWSLHSWLGIAVITAFVANVRGRSLYVALGWLIETLVASTARGMFLIKDPTTTTQLNDNTHTHARPRQYVVGVLFFFLQIASEPVKAAVLPQHVFLGLSLYFAAIFTVGGRVVRGGGTAMDRRNG